MKSIATTAAWTVYHQSLGPTKALYLNDSSLGQTNQSLWNNLDPTSQIWNAGSTGWYGNSLAYITYAWSEIEGYSRFGSYVGNDGAGPSPFCYCGFKPAYVLVKQVTGSGGPWVIEDTARSPYNSVDDYLLANESDKEETDSTMDINFLSNGFQIVGGSGKINNTGETFIFCAFASAPFKYANAH